MNQLAMMPTRVRIASELRKAIYAGEYQSGDELSLTEVANQLGISRTPVREAFQELEGEGLITLRMNRGAVVNQIDRKFIRDIYTANFLQIQEKFAVYCELLHFKEKVCNKVSGIAFFEPLQNFLMRMTVMNQQMGYICNKL